MIKAKSLFAMILSMIIITLLLAGCSGNTTANNQTAAPTDGVSTVPQEIVIGEEYDLLSIDPADGMFDDAQILVYNGLVELDTNFMQVPGLAEVFNMSEDGKTWTFNLRKGVKFHDGTPWNAEAAKINIERYRDRLATLDTIETPDDYTLILHLTQPTADLASTLAQTTMSMVAPSALDGEGKMTEAVGTGPYKLTSWKKDVEYIFEANPDFWDGTVNIKKITFKVITDHQSRAMALESGEIDMMSGYGALSAIKQFMNDDRFQLIMKTQNTSAVMFFNIEKSPLSSLKVRQAISHALDLDTMVNNLLVGLASPPKGFFSPAYGDIVNPDVIPTYDVEKAKTLLAEDGWVAGSEGILEKNGNKLAIKLTYSMSNTEDALLAPVMKDELGKIGIDVTLTPVEDAALWDLATEKDFDLLIIGQWFIPTDEPAMNYSRGYWHTNSNCPIYTSPELDALIDELAITMDKSKRVELHHKIQAKIMENAPTLMLYHRNSIRLAKKNITNFDISSGCWHINTKLKDAVVK